MEPWTSGLSNSLRPALDFSNTPELQSASFLLVPFHNNAVHYAADFQQLFLVMHHICPRESSDGVVFAQKNRLLGTDLLAHSAENAADHVDIEFLGVFFDFGEAVRRRNFAWNNFDCRSEERRVGKECRVGCGVGS